MIISELIRNNLNIKVKSVDECETDTLGLAVSNPKMKFTTFVDSAKFLDLVGEDVNVVITTEEVLKFAENRPFGLCVVDNPRLTFFKLHNSLANNSEYIRKQYPSKVGKSCSISKTVSIAENNVVIGNNVRIEENVVIKENTHIGDNSIIRAGCVIGGEGFEFKRDGDELFRAIHLGGVKIGKHVEVQYNSTIDKAIYPWDDTVIGDETKIDNLVYVAHAVKLGKRSMITANCVIGGRVEIGNDAWLGFAANVRNGIKIGNNVRLNIGAVVTKSVPDNCAVSGNFAIEHDKFIKKIKKEAK